MKDLRRIELTIFVVVHILDGIDIIHDNLVYPLEFSSNSMSCIICIIYNKELDGDGHVLVQALWWGRCCSTGHQTVLNNQPTQH